MNTSAHKRTRELSELNEKLIRDMDARAIAEEELHRTRQMLQITRNDVCHGESASILRHNTAN